MMKLGSFKRAATVFALTVVTQAMLTQARAEDVKDFTDDEVRAAAIPLGIECNDPTDLRVEKFSYGFRWDYNLNNPQAAVQTAVYYIATCPAGAYNESSVLFTVDRYENKLQVVPLATPMFNSDGKVTGWTAEIVTGGLYYDNATNTLTSFSKGRGLGDMFISATYALHEGNVILRKYLYDGTEGMEDEPITIFESTLPLERN